MFEKWIISQSFWFDTNQKDYLFATFDKVELTWESAQWRKDKLARAKQIIATVRDFEKKEMPATAEGEVKKLIPDIFYCVQVFYSQLTTLICFFFDSCVRNIDGHQEHIWYRNNEGGYAPA